MTPETDLSVDLTDRADPGHAAAVIDLNGEIVRFHRMIQALKSGLADGGPEGVESGAISLLAHLVKAGAMRQGELASSAALDPSTVSRHVSQLVQRGLVERRPHPDDGRAVHLVATSAGEGAFERIHRARLAMMQQILGDWSAEDVTTLTRLLGRLIDGVGAHRPVDLR